LTENIHKGEEKMKLKTIQIADGRSAEVDEARFLAFDGLRQHPQIASLLVGDTNVRDAQEALAFIVSQLAYTEGQVFEKLYTPMQYEQLLPIDYSAGEWADSIRYEIYDYAGRGKRSSGKGRDINLVDVAFADKTFPVMNGNIGYDYTTEELRRTAFLRRPISERKLMAAMDGYRRHMNDVGLYGSTVDNLTGLFTSASVPQASAPVGAWQTGPKTPDQILSDINAAINAVWANTVFNDFPTDIVMAPTSFAYISATARSANSDKTILQYVRDNNVAFVQAGVKLNFMPGYGLDTAGVGATKRLMAYTKNDQRLVFHIPLPLRFLAPQLIGLSVQIPGEYKYSGVEFRYPKSAYYMDGL
jgi:hypothetical protein